MNLRVRSTGWNQFESKIFVGSNLERINVIELRKGGLYKGMYEIRNI